MAYGRQRRVAAILKKKREEEAKKQGLNALSADSLTKVVSDDANDLDQVQFTTTNGAKVNIQNQRGKTEEGQTVTPTINTLGQSFSGGSLQNNLPQIDSLGTSYAGGSLQNLPVPEPELPQAVADFTGQPVGKSFSGGSLQNNRPQIGNLGTSYSGGATQADYGQDLDFAGQPMSTDFDGNVYDQQLNADILSEQMNRNSFTDDEGFMGTEVLEDPNRPLGTSYAGGSLQNAPQPVAPKMADTVSVQEKVWNPTGSFEESDDRGFYGSDNAKDLNELNKYYSDTINQKFSGGFMGMNPMRSAAQSAVGSHMARYQNLENISPEMLNDTRKMIISKAPGMVGMQKAEEILANHDAYAQKFMDYANEDAEVQAAPMTQQDRRAAMTAQRNQANAERANIKLNNELVDQGLLPEAERVDTSPQAVTTGRGSEADVAAHAAQATAVQEKKQDDLVQAGVDAGLITDPTEISEEQEMRNDMYAEGLNEDAFAEEPEVMDLSGDTVINSEDLTKNTLDPEVEAKESNNDIMAATAGDPEAAAVANGAKQKIEEIKTKVETGEIAPEEAKGIISSSLGELGDLLGIDKKDLVRALFRYAGARVFGSSNSSAGKFAYDGWVTDNSGATLGKNATAKQRNLAAYKSEIATIDADGTMTAEQKTAAKKTADQVFGVNKPTSMGRPVNIKGIVSATGAEEVVAGRRNESNSYDVFIDGQWIPVEESGLSEIQITGRGAEQAFERGVKDPRTGTGIDNATHVSSTGVPTFNFKTGDQRKSYQLAKRSVDSFPVIEGMLQDPKNVEALTSALGGLSTWAAGHANDSVTAASINLALGDSLPQKYKSATSAWLQALLRADTGAAYSETEIMDYIATNIPQVGDDKDTVQFKIAQMKSTTETMAANAGQGAKYLLNRLDGSVEAPDAVKRMHEIGIGKKQKVELNQADQDLVNKYL
ncbi:MAG: hypothetical protein V3S69_06375 [Dehalococcoidales bacterium]